jgi:hypothetical protein
MKNTFLIDYDNKILSLNYNEETFEFNLNDGDVGEFWNSFTTKDGVIKDINYHQEDETQLPTITVYGVHVVNGETLINTNDSEYITKALRFGDAVNYFKELF